MSLPIDALRGAFAFLLLPLSLVPLYFAVPKIRAEVGPDPDRAALAAPAWTPSKAQLQRWRPLPVARNAVPVLAFHGINDNNDHYSVTSAEFAQQMAMLRAAGFESIGIADYVRFLQGVGDGLPERPVLITFDDGRLDSYRGADKILAENGLRAVMFAIVGHTEQHSSFYLNWDELRWMMKSGRWDVQEHAGVMHENVTYDAVGHTGPAYAYRQYREGDGLESFSDFRARVRRDILWAKGTMSDELPGFMPWAFAVPFGSYGNDGTNDRRIPGYMRRLLQRNFPAVFMSEPAAYSTPTSHSSALPRFEIHGDTRTDDLYRWLRDRMPARPAHSEPLSRTRVPVSAVGSGRAGG